MGLYFASLINYVINAKFEVQKFDFIQEEKKTEAPESEVKA